MIDSASTARGSRKRTAMYPKRTSSWGPAPSCWKARGPRRPSTCGATNAGLGWPRSAGVVSGGAGASPVVVLDAILRAGDGSW